MQLQHSEEKTFQVCGALLPPSCDIKKRTAEGMKWGPRTEGTITLFIPAAVLNSCIYILK